MLTQRDLAKIFAGEGFDPPYERKVGFLKLIKPMSSDTFCKAVFRRKVLHFQLAIPEIKDVFGYEEITKLIWAMGRDPNNHVEVFRESRLEADANCNARVALDAFQKGKSVVIRGLDRLVPVLSVMRRSLENHLLGNANINCYMTPSGKQTLHAHKDDYDVFAIQCEGSKNWLVESIDTHISAVIEKRLEVGDILYIPKGTKHQARARREPSVHLTVGFKALTLGDLIRQMKLPLRERTSILSTPLAIFASSVREKNVCDELMGLVGDDIESVGRITEAIRRISKRRTTSHNHSKNRLDLDIEMNPAMSLEGYIVMKSGIRLSLDDNCGEQLIVKEEDLVTSANTLLCLPKDSIRLVEHIVRSETPTLIRNLPGKVPSALKLVVCKAMFERGWLKYFGSNQLEKSPRKEGICHGL